MHPNILYAMEGVQAPADIYTPVIDALKQMGYSNVTKFTVKQVILMGINSKGYQGLTSAINMDKGKELKANQHKVRNGLAPKPILYDELKAQGLNAKVILQAFQQANPTISKYVHSALPNLWMFIESQIMTEVLSELMNRDIPAVPIHDSLLFAKTHRDEVMQVMKDVYRQQTGFDIQVK